MDRKVFTSANAHMKQNELMYFGYKKENKAIDGNNIGPKTMKTQARKLSLFSSFSRSPHQPAASCRSRMSYPVPPPGASPARRQPVLRVCSQSPGRALRSFTITTERLVARKINCAERVRTGLARTFWTTYVCSNLFLTFG